MTGGFRLVISLFLWGTDVDKRKEEVISGHYICHNSSRKNGENQNDSRR